MDSKKNIINLLRKVHLDLTETISMVENGQDCLNTHLRLIKTIHQLQITKKEILNRYLDECLNKLYKNNRLGQKARQEVINLFQT